MKTNSVYPIITDETGNIAEALGDNLISGASVSIESEHHEIHGGHHYFHSSIITIAGSASANIILETDGAEQHFTYSIGSDIAGFTLYSYEKVTADSNGTLLPTLNNNRNSTNTSALVVRLNPTNVSTVGSTAIRSAYVGTAGTGVNRSAGTITRSTETILKFNTKYLIRITNLSASSNDINLTFSFYE